MKYIYILFAFLFAGIASPAAAQQIGDIKEGFQTTDHGGWYLLDGRAVSSITDAVAKANAQSLNLSSLPNTTNKYIRGLVSGETAGGSRGSNGITLTLANLPTNILTGASITVSTDGNHNHSMAYIKDTYNTGSLYVVRQDDGYDPNTTFAGFRLTNNMLRNTADAGSHTHDALSMNFGGSGTAIPTNVPNLGVNTFIYLGAASTQEAKIGDIKYSFSSSDQASVGWYLADGRSVSSISNATAKANATTMFSSNIPNLAGYTVETRNAETLGNTTATSQTLQYYNIPRLTRQATTNAVSHYHSTQIRAVRQQGVSATGNAWPFQTINTIPYWTNYSETNGTLSTDYAGSHSHGISSYGTMSGASSSAIDMCTIIPCVVFNTFVYLGY